MITIKEIKKIIDNYNKTKKSFDRRIYNYHSCILEDIQNLKKFLNRQILIKNEIKKSFNDLHFLKMLEHYIYLRFYHENIQKLLYNERLLRYFEKVIRTKGFYPTKWDPDYNLVGVLEDIIYFLPG